MAKFALFLILSALVTFRAEAQETRVRAAFWNIQWFPGRHPNAAENEQRSQIHSVQRDIATLNPDILGMEEVRDFPSATLAVAPLGRFKVDVISNFPPREGQDVAQQVAIASRLSPVSAWCELWKPAGPLVPPRGFAFAAYEISPRKLLLVYPSISKAIAARSSKTSPFAKNARASSAIT